jgi:hypothetical protein
MPATHAAPQLPSPPSPPRDLTVPFTRTFAGTLPTDLAVTSKGWVYLVGSTRDATFATTENAYDRTCGTDGRCNPFQGRFGIQYQADVTLTVFDPNGAVHYSSYLGGAGEDGATRVALATDGGVWLAGPTSSTTFEGQPAPGTCGGTSSAIWIAHFDVGLRNLQEFRCVLGSGSVLDLTLDAQGDAWLTGTADQGVPVANPWQPVAGGQIDAYVLEIARGQSAPRTGTYIGGNSLETPYAVAVAPNGAIVVTGSTTSSNFPVVRAFQETWAGPFPIADAFIVSLDPAGRVANFSTLLGGAGAEAGMAAAVDVAGNIFVALQSSSDDLLTTPDAYDRRCGTGAPCATSVSDAAIVKLSPTGALLASTFLGGSGLDYPRHLSVLSDGSILVGGETQSMDFPLVPAGDPEGRAFTSGFLAVLDGNLRTLRASMLMTDPTFRPPAQRIAHKGDFTYVAGQITIAGPTGPQPATWLRKLFRAGR